ncbi:MAG TPA: MFS transporter [Candidatus Binatia bacterium]|nr:MFS transporter [Candidatus Binatia bacterium]
MTLSTRKRLVLAATVLGSGIAFLDGSIVTLALPKIQSALNTSFSDLQWIVVGYSLSLGSLMLLGGSLGDIFGRKRIYLVGLIGFGLTSLLCATAPNVNALIAARIVQGAFGALLVPGGLAIINTNFPREERGAAIGKWTAFSGSFAVIGPLAGGYLLDVASWRWIFFINLPLIALCALLGSKSIEETKDDKPRQIDVGGAILAALALSGICYGLIHGPTTNWAPLSVISLVIGGVLTVGFLWWESVTKDPMVPLGLFRSRNFAGSNAMTLTMYGALAGFMFALVIYLQTKMGYSSLIAGISLLPVALLMAFFSSKVGRLSAKHGPRLFMAVGPLISAVAMLLLLSYSPGDRYLSFLLPRVILFGIGLTLMVAPLTTTVMTSVSDSSSGIASGINNDISRIGGLVTVAVLGILGTAQVFRFSMGLCAVLAASAGVMSLLIIRNPKH